MTMNFKPFSRAVLAVACAMAVQGAWAANATLILDQAPVAQFEGSSYVSLGGASLVPADGTTSQLTAPVTVAGNIVDFANSDGFNFLGGLVGNVAFTNLSFNLDTNTLYGTLQGGGLFLNALAYTGDLIVAGTVEATGANTTTYGTFDFSQGLRDYFIEVTAPESLVPVNLMVASVTLPVATAPAVPEPATFALMGLGLVGLSLVARKRG
jgi:hypothetical protein